MIKWRVRFILTIKGIRNWLKNQEKLKQKSKIRLNQKDP